MFPISRIFPRIRDRVCNKCGIVLLGNSDCNQCIKYKYRYSISKKRKKTKTPKKTTYTAVTSKKIIDNCVRIIKKSWLGVPLPKGLFCRTMDLIHDATITQINRKNVLNKVLLLSIQVPKLLYDPMSYAQSLTCLLEKLRRAGQVHVMVEQMSRLFYMLERDSMFISEGFTKVKQVLIKECQLIFGRVASVSHREIVRLIHKDPALVYSVVSELSRFVASKELNAKKSIALSLVISKVYKHIPMQLCQIITEFCVFIY